jgi:hypothetical protein
MSRFSNAPASNPNNDVLALLSMLSNPEDLRKKLEELQNLQREVDAKVALVGPADQILIMQSNIEIMQTEAVHELEKAKVKAEEIIAQAHADAETVLRDAQGVHAQTVKECCQLSDDAKAEAQILREQLENEKRDLLASRDAQLAEIAQLRAQIVADKKILLEKDQVLNQAEKTIFEKQITLDDAIKRNHEFENILQDRQRQLESLGDRIQKELYNIMK